MNNKDDNINNAINTKSLSKLNVIKQKLQDSKKNNLEAKVNKQKNYRKIEFQKNDIYKSLIKKIKNINNLKHQMLLLIIIILIFIPKLALNQILSDFRKLNMAYIVTLNFDGTGKDSQQILGHKFKSLPSTILVNGNIQQNITNIAYNIIEGNNNVTMIWDYDFESCEEMFYNLSDINEINFRNFESSKIKNMKNMFFKCSSLTSLDLNNFDVSLVTTMERVFSDCSSLSSIEFKNFNTSSLKIMNTMFYDCNALEILDINIFDTSLVTSMVDTFFNCKSLKQINMGNINTKSVETMRGLFYGCNSIKSIDLSNFDTSSLKNTQGMFCGCSSLESLNINNFNMALVTSTQDMFNRCSKLKQLDLSNFNTKSVTNMQGMFYGCSQLIELNLNSFDTSSVQFMEGMFGGCSSLTSLNINNFNTSLVKDIGNMFNGCRSLESLNLIKFNISLVEKSGGIFYDINKNIILCVNENNTELLDKIESKLIGKVTHDNEKCIQNCSLDGNFTFEFNNKCYSECPEGTHLSSNNGNLCIEGLEEANSIINAIQNIEYTEKISDLREETKSSEIYVKIPNTEMTQIISKTEINKEFENTEETKIITNSVINEGSQKSELTEEVKLTESIENVNIRKYLDINDFYEYYENIIHSYNNSELNGNIFSNIHKDLSDGNLYDLIFSNKSEDKDLLIKGEGVIFQVTSSENQKNNNYYNLSVIKLGKCETLLKQKYNISENGSLIIFKVEYFQDGLLIPIIEYEVYNPISHEKLELDVCQENLVGVVIEIPVTIDEENLFKYNSSSEYYNDLCCPHTTDKGTDIILSDRKNEFENSNYSLCEKNCEYNGYDADTKKALCECQVKTKMDFFLNINFDEDKLLNNIIDFKKNTNIYTMKCYKLVFSKEGLKNNIGNHIIFAIILLNIILAILFRMKGFPKLCEQIEQLTKIENKNNKKTISIFNKKNKIIKKKEKKEKKDKKSKKNKKKEKNSNKKVSKKKNNKKIDSNYNQIKSNINPPKKLKNSNKYSQSNNSTKINLKKIDKNDYEKRINDFNLSNNNILEKEKIKVNKKYKYNDYELNNLDYIKAKEIDKRSYLKYYFSLLKRKQLIIFTFYTSDDYNSKILKIFLLLFSFSLYYTVNALFFNDSTMHKIYEDEGSFNFIYQLPNILYSTIISTFISTLIKFFSLTENNILPIKSAQKNINEMKLKILKCLVFKFITFFLLDFIFLLLFWYYLSSFCSVYKNTQTHLITDTLVSFGLSMIYPFGINLLPGIFRIPSLNSSKKDKKCMYIFSKILQIF